MTDTEMESSDTTLQQQLTSEVVSLVTDRMNGGDSVPSLWLVHELMQRHDRVEGEDADLALLGLRTLFQRTVREVLRKTKAEETATEVSQSELFGGSYTRVQRRYLVNRNGDQVVVRVEALTEEEWRTKCRELRAMGEGCFTHAKELEDFFAGRAQVGT